MMLLPGEVSVAKAAEKSAEAIVTTGNEPLKRWRTHRGSEGPNVRLFQMLQGGISQPCIKRNREIKSELK